MINSTLGAPLGGTTRGGHQVLESLALSLITPPNFGGGGGSCLPSMVVVALGDPGWPVACCAATGVAASNDAAIVAVTPSLVGSHFMPILLRVDPRRESS